MTAANFSALQHHYADGVTADVFLRLFAAKKPSLLKLKSGIRMKVTYEGSV